MRGEQMSCVLTVLGLVIVLGVGILVREVLLTVYLKDDK